MRTVALEGGSLTDVAPQLLHVAAWVPVMFTVAVVALRPKHSTVRRVEPRLVEGTA